LFSRFLLILALASLATAATGDVSAVRVIYNTCTAGVSCNGWVAEIDLEGLSTGGTYSLGMGTNNDPAAAKIVFTVTSPGYTTAGASTTIQRTVYGTQWLRKPYPNNASKDETAGTPLTVRVALSDFIYSGDTATVSIGSGFYTGSNAVTDLSVTNNSTLTHPKPVGRWAWPAYERVTADFLLEFVAFHRSARNGKPLAALKYSCVDEHSNTVTSTVNDMTMSARTGDANKVLVYAATILVTSLTQGDVITCNATAYPWVGDVTLNSDLVANGGDGFAQPEERLGPYEVVLDKAGTYPHGFAVVKAGGLASSAATYVHSSQASAESDYAGDNTHAYSTIGYALQALKTYNNADANFPHDDPGGGTVLLPEASYTWSSTGRYSESGTQKLWVTLTKLSTAARANTTLAAGGSSAWNTQKIKFTDLNLAGSASGVLSSRVASDVLWLHDNTINYTADGAVYQWKTAHATHNAVTDMGQGFDYYGGQRCAYSLVRGNTATALIPAQMYSILGNINVQPSRFIADSPDFTQQASDNSIVAFNTLYGLPGSMFSTSPASTQAITHGIAFVQNVFEKTAASTALLIIAGDGSSSDPANNIMLWHNTIVGERLNFAYNDFNLNGGSAKPRINESVRGNLFDRWSTVTDIDPHGGTADGVRTGNWSVRHGVGMASNIFASWPYIGEFIGTHSIKSDGALGAYDLAYVDNASNTGDASGNGDYHLTATSPGLNLIASGEAVLPYDLEGIVRRNDGTGSAGAYEYGPLVTLRNRVQSGTTLRGVTVR
jgi:hypothetical protein